MLSSTKMFTTQEIGLFTTPSILLPRMIDAESTVPMAILISFGASAIKEFLTGFHFERTDVNNRLTVRKKSDQMFRGNVLM